MQEMERLKREHQEQAMLIEYLEQELEMERQSLVEMRGGGDGGGDNGVDVEGRRKSLEDEQQKQSSSKSLSTTSKDNGSWTSWMDRYWIKIWERDITGLKSEVKEESIDQGSESEREGFRSSQPNLFASLSFFNFFLSLDFRFTRNTKPDNY